jgi:hypothetical protein
MDIPKHKEPPGSFGQVSNRDMENTILMSEEQLPKDAKVGKARSIYAGDEEPSVKILYLKSCISDRKLPVDIREYFLKK